MFTIALMGGIHVVNSFVGSLFLYLGARWSKLPRPGFVRSFMVVLCQTTISLTALWLILLPLKNSVSPDKHLALYALFALFSITISLVLIGIWLGGSFGRIFKAWIVSAVCTVAIMSPFVSFVVKPYLVEAYVVSSSSMSPNVRGAWTQSTCPKCGKSMIVGAPNPDEPNPIRRELLRDQDMPAICEACYHSQRVPASQSNVQRGDQIICNKLKRPERWNVVCHHSPLLSDINMKRLVGLPGETLFIRDGAIWINGEKLQPPSSIGPIIYTEATNQFLRPGERTWGSPEAPVTLGPDEFFLLGDNTDASADSRMGGPVKGDALMGVVEVIYAPLNRARILP